MESAVVAGLAGLLGLALGRLWDHRSELSRWRRDERLRCYQDLMSSYYRLRESIRLLSATDPGTKASDAAANSVFEVGTEWSRDMVAVWLHGSESVTAVVKELDDRLMKLFLSAWAKQFTWNDWLPARIDAEAALERLILAIRRDLALPEFPIRILWHPDQPGSDASKSSIG